MRPTAVLATLLAVVLLPYASASEGLEELLGDQNVHLPHQALANPSSRLMRQLFVEQSNSKEQQGEVHGIAPHLNGGALSFELGEVSQVRRAELHFRLRPAKRHRNKYSKKKEREYVAEAGGAELGHLGVWPGDWTVFDATDAVRKSAGGALEARLSVRRAGRGLKRVGGHKALRHHRPFLLVFAGPPDAHQPLLHNRLKRSTTSYFAYNRGNETAEAVDGGSALHLKAFLSEGPDALETKKEARRARKLRAKRRRGQRRRQKGRRGGRYLAWPAQETLLEDGRNSSANRTPKDASVVLLGGRRLGGPEGGCRREGLELAWARLGMGDWVIAPKSLDLGQCLGGCGSAGAAFSNHARLLGAARAAGLAAEAPAACVPSSLDSATLLFFDRKGNVVLKNFPDLVLKSCACQ